MVASCVSSATARNTAAMCPSAPVDAPRWASSMKTPASWGLASWNPMPTRSSRASRARRGRWGRRYAATKPRSKFGSKEALLLSARKEGPVLSRPPWWPARDGRGQRGAATSVRASPSRGPERSALSCQGPPGPRCCGEGRRAALGHLEQFEAPPVHQAHHAAVLDDAVAREVGATVGAPAGDDVAVEHDHGQVVAGAVEPHPAVATGGTEAPEDGQRLVEVVAGAAHATAVRQEDRARH